MGVDVSPSLNRLSKTSVWAGSNLSTRGEPELLKAPQRRVSLSLRTSWTRGSWLGRRRTRPWRSSSPTSPRSRPLRTRRCPSAPASLSPARSRSSSPSWSPSRPPRPRLTRAPRRSRNRYRHDAAGGGRPLHPPTTTPTAAMAMLPSIWPGLARSGVRRRPTVRGAATGGRGKVYYGRGNGR